MAYIGKAGGEAVGNPDGAGRAGPCIGEAELEMNLLTAGGAGIVETCRKGEVGRL